MLAHAEDDVHGHIGGDFFRRVPNVLLAHCSYVFIMFFNFCMNNLSQAYA